MFKRNHDRGRDEFAAWGGDGRRPEIVRHPRELEELLSGIDVGDRYPQSFDDPGLLDAVRVTLAGDRQRGMSNGSVDESSIGPMASKVVGASLAVTRAHMRRHEVENEIALDALAAAEAEQVRYLEDVLASYGQ